MDNHYNDRHRIFLQSIMQTGIMLHQDVNELIIKTFDARMRVQTVVADINEKLNSLAMKIDDGTCEFTGQTYWALVNTVHDESILYPSEYSVDQRSLLRCIYSEIIASETGCVSSMDCVNLTRSADIKISMENAQHFLDDLVKKKWLFNDEHGHIYMGVRSIIEMMPYFRATFGDNFHNCRLCKNIAFHGTKCLNCNTIYHNYCIAKFVKIQKKNSFNCDNCKAVMDNVDLNNSYAQEDTQAQDMEVTNDDDDDLEEVINISSHGRKKVRQH